jgi:hypothetical protein
VAAGGLDHQRVLQALGEALGPVPLTGEGEVVLGQDVRGRDVQRVERARVRLLREGAERLGHEKGVDDPLCLLVGVLHERLLEHLERGPVGRLLDHAGRSPMRAPHLHFMVTAPGFRRLITHIFVAGDPWVDNDSVFGVKESLVRPFDRHDAETPTPDGRQVAGRWTSTSFDIVLRKE